jgi:hypothetical protein
MIEASYQHYYNISAPGFLTIDGVFAGAVFLERCLAERNLILNVSSVVWRRSALLEAFGRCETALDTFTVAGDWRLYAELLSVPGARIAYVASPLNRHRRRAGRGCWMRIATSQKSRRRRRRWRGFSLCRPRVSAVRSDMWRRSRSSLARETCPRAVATQRNGWLAPPGLSRLDVDLAANLAVWEGLRVEVHVVEAA